MIDFASQNDFAIAKNTSKKDWIQKVVRNEGKQLGELSYVFCDDNFLHTINVEFLNHDTLTDVISFDYTQGDVVGGEIYISTERVADNAKDLNIAFTDELDRVIVHGLLHFCGYSDKSDLDKEKMRELEDFYLARRT